MSLPGSPHSLTGDDLAVLLDFELQAGSEEDENCDEEAECQGLEECENEVKELAKQNARCPPHPGFMWDVCIRCGAQKAASETVEAGVSLRYIHEGLEVTKSEAARLRSDELGKLKERKKLYLVLDLDHTLLNSALFVEVPPEEEAYCTSAYSIQASSGLGRPNASGNAGGLPNSHVSLHKLVDLQMWTKLRPFVHRFLEEASKCFEMYVYTMGERINALAMARLLDPSGRFFGERIISQGDSTRRTSKDLDVVLGAESAVIILDDTEAVWRNHGANLILIERYHFFGASCKQGQSFTKAHKDESELEGTLATMLKTLLKVHHSFYSTTLPGRNGRHGDPFASKDVTKTLEEVRSKILEGCNILFSRVFPTASTSLGDSREKDQPENHHLWRLTERLGAQCSRNQNSSITHVVALDRGTVKAQWARSNKRFLVHPRWVEAALYLWRKSDEQDFPVGDDETVPPVTTFGKTVEVHPAGGPQNGGVAVVPEDEPGVAPPGAKKRCLEEVGKGEEAAKKLCLEEVSKEVVGGGVEESKDGETVAGGAGT